MKTYEITHETLLNKVQQNLDACESFNRNIENALRGFCENAIFSDEHGLIESIRYNQQMLKVYAERAAAILELVGLLDADNDIINLETLHKLYDKLSA